MSLLNDIFGLTHQVAVVTGAGSGLGRISSYALAEAGADVVLVDINPTGMEETAAHVRSLGRQAHSFTADVADEGQVAAIFAEMERTVGPIDILVNNAGIGEPFRGMIHEYPTEDWQRMLNINLNSVFYCSREVLKGMHSRRKGKIINISSIWGLVGGGFLNAGGYTTTKGAVVNLTREMALEYASHNVQINVICPGFHRTGLGTNDPHFVRLMESHTPAGRIAEPSELQGTILYLASSASDFMNGSIIAVDGGFVAQ
ncbi:MULTISPECIES: SDR family NAD(P)-dependent oxidoreductase [Sphingobium]|uniref:SDR family NAD(P)-dependent oxidoreductase n=1 Tax=Sphingobium TaxID=165695 RepID=UPI00159C1A79|nr:MULTISPECIES: SDR family oxidoreductase [unclassified Sphingobium]